MDHTGILRQLDAQVLFPQVFAGNHLRLFSKTIMRQYGDTLQLFIIIHPRLQNYHVLASRACRRSSR